MRFWLQLLNTPPEEIVPLARLAESCGYEGVLEPDHWYMPPDSDDRDPYERAVMPWDYTFSDPFVTGAAVLSQTTTLKFGTGVLILANRDNPLLVAKSASTLARLSGDRFIMGVGLGWMKAEFDIAGIDFRTRAARTVEMVEVMRKLWGPGPVEHHGRFFDFPPTYAIPTPAEPVPVYFGGYVAASARRAGRIADGWFAATSRLEEIAESVIHVDEGRREAGREREPFDVMASLARNPDGTLPGPDDFRRAEDVGVTTGKFGPVEHVIAKPYATFEDKREAIEDFATRVIHRTA